MSSTILIIEDERLVAEYIASVLQQASYTTVAIASNRNEAVSVYKSHNVSLVISDVNLFGLHQGPLIVKELLAIKSVPVVYLTAYSEQQTLDDALATEPAAYVLKPFTERQLLVAVKMALRVNTDEDNFSSSQKPSGREAEIVHFLASGYNSKEIADELFISEHTVRTHRRNLLKKFDVKSTSELIAMAVKLKWI